MNKKGFRIFLFSAYIIFSSSGCAELDPLYNGPSCEWDPGTCVNLVSKEPEAITEFENWCGQISSWVYSTSGCDLATYDLPEAGACQYPGSRIGISDNYLVSSRYDSSITWGIYFRLGYYSNQIENWEADCIADGGEWIPPLITINW